MKPQVYANKTLVIQETRPSLSVGFIFFVFYHGNKSRLSVLLVLFGHYLWNYFGLCLILWNNMYLLRYFIRVKHCGWLLGNKYFHIFFHWKNQVCGTCNWLTLKSLGVTWSGTVPDVHEGLFLLHVSCSGLAVRGCVVRQDKWDHHSQLEVCLKISYW